MSDISPISNRQARLSAVNGSRKPADVDQPRSRAKTDSVELSKNAQLLAKLAQLPEVRIDLVNRVKGEIRAGNYDTDDKLATAVNNLADSDDLA